MTKQPMQPVYLDEEGRGRFLSNAIVSFLQGWACDHGMTLSELSRMPSSKEDWKQFSQLCGCAVDEFAELYAGSEESAVADRQVKELKYKAKVEALPPLEIGDRVRVEGRRGKKWIAVVWRTYDAPTRYYVKLGDGSAGSYPRGSLALVRKGTKS